MLPRGIKSFKKGMNEEEAAATDEDGKTVEHRADEAVKATEEKASKS